MATGGCLPSPSATRSTTAVRNALRSERRRANAGADTGAPTSAEDASPGLATITNAQSLIQGAVLTPWNQTSTSRSVLLILVLDNMQETAWGDAKQMAQLSEGWLRQFYDDFIKRGIRSIMDRIHDDAVMHIFGGKSPLKVDGCTLTPPKPLRHEGRSTRYGRSGGTGGRSLMVIACFHTTTGTGAARRRARRKILSQPAWRKHAVSMAGDEWLEPDDQMGLWEYQVHPLTVGSLRETLASLRGDDVPVQVEFYDPDQGSGP